MKNQDKNKIGGFLDTLLKPYDIDNRLADLKKYDHSLPKLYLGERVIAFFEVYKNIVMYAVTTMKMISLDIYQNPDDLKSESLVKAIKELAPLSKEGFDKNGDTYAFHLSTYFCDGIMTELRNDLFGSEAMDQDADSAVRLLVDSNNAKLKVSAAFEKYGLSEQLLKK